MIGLNNEAVLLTSLTAAVLLLVQSGVRCEPLCLTGDFDTQLRYILHQQKYSDNISSVYDDVRTTLKLRWQGFKLVLFGSIITGLATKSSDVDFIVQLRNLNASAEPYLLQEAEQVFKNQPSQYSDVHVEGKPRFPHLEFLHIPSQRGVDLVFRYDHGVQDSKLLKYYFNLDERHLVLARFLKYWFKIHGLTKNATDKLSSYGLYVMIIFYLQQKKMAPPGYELQVDSKSNFIGNWDMGFSELPYRSANTDSLHELLGGFFKYYSKFNFEEYIVSPFTGRPIPRNAFADIDNFPIEYTLYNKTLKRATQLRTKNDLNISSAVCIQAVFEHDTNEGAQITHEYATRYKSLLKTVATMFEDLPSDRILTAILVMEQFGQTNAIVHEINEQNCVEVKSR